MDKKEALDGARAFCSHRETCGAEVVRKLVSRGVPADWHQEILDTLKREGYLDEMRFARAYVNDKIWLNQWGRVKVRYMLGTLHISREVTTQVLGELDEEQYRDLLRSLLDRNRRSGSLREQKPRLFRFAVARGFENDLVLKELNRWEE